MNIHTWPDLKIMRCSLPRAYNGGRIANASAESDESIGGTILRWGIGERVGEWEWMIFSCVWEWKRSDVG